MSYFVSKCHMYAFACEYTPRGGGEGSFERPHQDTAAYD